MLSGTFALAHVALYAVGNNAPSFAGLWKSFLPIVTSHDFVLMISLHVSAFPFWDLGAFSRNDDYHDFPPEYNFAAEVLAKAYERQKGARTGVVLRQEQEGEVEAKVPGFQVKSPFSKALTISSSPFYLKHVGLVDACSNLTRPSWTKCWQMRVLGTRLKHALSRDQLTTNHDSHSHLRVSVLQTLIVHCSVLLCVLKLTHILKPSLQSKTLSNFDQSETQAKHNSFQLLQKQSRMRFESSATFSAASLASPR